MHCTYYTRRSKEGIFFGAVSCRVNLAGEPCQGKSLGQILYRVILGGLACGGAEEKLCALRKQPPAAVLQLLRGSAAVSAKCSEFLRWEDQSKHSESLLQSVHHSHCEQPGGLSTSSALQV